MEEHKNLLGYMVENLKFYRHYVESTDQVAALMCIAEALNDVAQALRQSEVSQSLDSIASAVSNAADRVAPEDAIF